MPPFILASSSPRRKELLEQVQYSFTIQTSTIEERVESDLTPAEVVEHLAKQKAEDVLSRNPQAVVLGADTVVVLNEKILGKPKSEEEAKLMLNMLSGRSHCVYTGVAICSIQEVITFHEKTEVEFYPLDEEEITNYIRTNEPFDKAGSYGIQGIGAYLVKRMVGDYFSVVGLPLAKTMRRLTNFGIHPNR